MENYGKIISQIKKKTDEFKNPVVTKIGKVNKSKYKVLISCILSLRTKDETTYPASKRLFKLARTPKEMLSLTTKQIEKAIYPVGFYRTKARRIKEISKTLLKKHNGKVPETFEDLMNLKGVGRKTANIVMVYGHKKEGLPIDTHCHRIPNRLGWVKTKNPDKTEECLRKILPKKYWEDFNNTFVTFGQNVCRPVKPHCWECPVTRYCKYYREVYLLSSKANI
jgi:endonuclease III